MGKKGGSLVYFAFIYGNRGSSCIMVRCYIVCTSSYMCFLSTYVLYLSLFSALCLVGYVHVLYRVPISDVTSSVVVRTPPFATGGK